MSVGALDIGGVYDRKSGRRRLRWLGCERGGQVAPVTVECTINTQVLAGAPLSAKVALELQDSEPDEGRKA